MNSTYQLCQNKEYTETFYLSIMKYEFRYHDTIIIIATGFKKQIHENYISCIFASVPSDNTDQQK